MKGLPAWLMALLLSWTAGANAQQYSVVRLPYPAAYPPNNSAPAPLGYAINAGGEVTGFLGPDAGGLSPAVTLGSSGFNLWLGSSPGSALFLYSGGVTSNLGSYNPIGSSGFGFCGSNSPSVGFAINASAQITGAVCATTETPTAFSYQNGSFNLIELPGTLAGWGHGINSSGLIVGILQLPESAPGCPNTYHTFLYNSSSAEPLDGVSPGASQDLGPFFGCSSWGYAINDSGQIAGTVTDSSGNLHGYLYSYNSVAGTGSAIDIGNIACPNNPAFYASDTVAIAISASTQVTGWSSRGCGNGPDAFLYNNGQLTDIGNLGGAGGSQGNAINASGQITGLSYTPGNASVHAFIYSNGSPMLDLNSLISSADAAQYTLVDGVAINDGGQILVQGYVNSNSGQTVTFLLSPPPPTIVPQVNGTQGLNGWYISNFTVSWAVSGQSITSESGCASSTVATDTTGQTFTCTATNGGGTTTQSVIVKRDGTPPMVTATPSPTPDTYGWNNSAVTVTFSGADATSGIASCSAPVIVSAQGANQSASGSCTDNAGNVGTATVTPINIELTPPVVSDVITDSVPESPTSWYTAPVTITFAGTDPLSGVAPGACTEVTLSSSGAGQTATGTCTNLAGDVGTLTVSGINVDLTIPVATYTAAPPPNANGWNNTPVTVTFSGTDSVNGSGIASCTAPIALSTSAAAQLATGTCTSVAGTVSAPVTDIVNINLTPPTAVIINPPNNAGYPIGANVIASYRCTDASSGAAAASCSGTVANGSPIDTSTAGSQTFSVTATDLAGNTTTASTGYLISTLTLTTPGSIWTYAGNGTGGFAGDGGPAINAELNYPQGVAVDSAGNVYIADTANDRIRKVAKDGTISTFAGNGLSGFGGDGGPATSAGVGGPVGVAVDSSGNLYISAIGDERVRKVTVDGTISTVAGNGTTGFGGDGGPATSANLFDPSGIAVDDTGNIYIADLWNQRIRKVTIDGVISTVAGNGTAGFSGDGGPATSASLNLPVSVAADTSGNLYIADSANQRIRKVAPDGTISTFAGNGTEGFGGDGSPATSAELNNPYGVAVDANGNVYIANLIGSIRKVAPNGTISTVAGNGLGFGGDGGAATSAQLDGSDSVALDSSGNLFIADEVNQRVRLVPGVVVTDTTPPVVAPTITGTQGTNGWYVSNVIVTWTVTDPLAPIISQTGCGTTTISTDTTGQVVTCTAIGQGGTNTQSVTIKRDATPPVPTATPSPLPNGNGWNNSAVNVTFTGTDSTSGVASCSPPVTVSTQGANQSSASGTCTDNAGNVSAAVSATNINIDTTPPVVSGTAAPSANVNGWNNTPVTVTFTATDTLSGVAANGCHAPVVLSTNGVGQSVTGSCTDKAGNSASTTVNGINIDTIAPVATATATPAPNAAGWNDSTVTVSFSGTDNLNGSGITNCSPSVILSASGANQIATGTCTDKAGNTSAPTKDTVNIDETVPSVSITTPANGASYVAGSTVDAAYSCTDSLSGVASCVGTVGIGSPISTSAAGTYGFSVSATSVAGTSATGTTSYTVVAAAPGYTLAPNPLAFGSHEVNTSTSLIITLTSTGNVALPITSIAVSGGNAGQFSETNTCGTSVVPNTPCSITVVFKPTSAGAKTSTIKVTAGGGAGSKTVTLSGSGVDATYSMSPTSIAFGNQAEGVASAMTITITNTGSVPLPITGIALGGTNPGQFSILNTVPSGDILCPITGGTLPASGSAGSTCELIVQFLPTLTGNKTATLKVTSGGDAAAQSVTLSGTGIVPTYSLSPTTLAFGNQTHGTSSAPLPITLTNMGTLAVPITSITASGMFSEANNCGGSVAAGATCTIEVTFAPTTKGAKTGTLKVTAGGGAATMTASLTGTGT